MAWLLRSPSPNPISALLGAEGTSLIQVIGDPNFPLALRVPTVQLCEFLTREDRIDELFDWILTDIHGNDENAEEQLKDMDGILIAPGFGQRGIEGKFAAIKYAREHDVPCLGICLGMQCMVIEFARDVLGYKDANSTEMEPHTTHKVIDLMEDQKNVTNMGGSMRLGAYDCTLKEGSKIYEAYGKEHIQERHRHRFEFNNEYKEQFEAAGMKCTGENPDTNLVEVVEIPTLKWFIGVQYHPEYNSTVVNPNPLFLSFVKAAIDNKKK